jgi:hypothetical protein
MSNPSMAARSISSCTPSFPMVVDGRVVGPTSKEQWKELTNIFPNTQEVWVGTPHVTIKVSVLPPKPWPFTIGHLPLHLMAGDANHDPMDRGRPIFSKISSFKSTWTRARMLTKYVAIQPTTCCGASIAVFKQPREVCEGSLLSITFVSRVQFNTRRRAL